MGCSLGVQPEVARWLYRLVTGYRAKGCGCIGDAGLDSGWRFGVEVDKTRSQSQSNTGPAASDGGRGQL